MNFIIFSTRELAIICWFSILFIFITIYFIKVKKLDNIFNVLKAIFVLIKQPIMLISLGYTGFLFYIFYNMELFNEVGLIKDYLKLIVFALIPMIFKVCTKYKQIDANNLVLSTFKFSMIPLFIINEYTFNFFIELFLVLIASVLTFLLIVAETKIEYEPVRKLFNWILTIIGIYILVFAFTSFLGNISDLKEITFWKKMLLEVLLLCHIPLLIFLQLSMYYEQIMIRVKIKSQLANELKGKIIIYFLIIKNCHINKEKLDKALQKVIRNRIQTYEDFEELLKE